MKRYLNIYLISLIVLTAGQVTGGDREIDDVAHKDATVRLLKPFSYADEAVGVMDKGQLQNLTMNYGQITDTRYEDVGNAPTQYFFDFRYPRKNFTGLIDDFSIFFALPENTKNNNNGNVIDGWTDNDNEDWVAKDGSYGATHYNPATDPNPHAPIMYPPDSPTTPYLAHSDLPATWPIDAGGQAFWPGYFQRDRLTGDEIIGEFASDRDVYAVFDDSQNQQGNVIGIEVEMMAYCYGRPYADKFQFYEFFIHNTSGRTLDSCYVGYYQDPDCSDYGEEILILSDPTFSDPDIPDVILQRDIDGDIGGATRPNSNGVTEDFSFGIIILETPKDMGVTTFHYYQDSGPTNDNILWPIITNQPADPDLSGSSSNYFHGSDVQYDDVDLLYTVPKQDLVYIVATGPFTLEPGETVKSTVAVLVGENDADFYDQVDQAVQMYDFKFIGPTAPPAPTLSVVPGDGEVTLYWDAVPETKPDAFSGELDFEGYRIYRSQDNGQTWGKELIDAQGNLIGYLPVAQFDLDNGISGPDPRNPFTFLGEDSGLRHTWVDTDVMNGINYSYTVVSYDRGNDQIYSLESARGTSIADRNFVQVTPTPDYLGKIPAEIASFEQTAGSGKGEVAISVIDDRDLGTDQYAIQFNGTPATSFELVNVTSAETLATNLPLNFSDNPVKNGFQVSVESEQKIGGIKRLTDGYGNLVSGGLPDSTGNWTASASVFAPGSAEYRKHDFEIRFTDTGSWAYSWGATNSVASFRTSFEVWDVTTGVNQQVEYQVEDVNANSTWDEGEKIFVLTSTYIEPQQGDAINAVFPAEFTYIAIITNAAVDTLNRKPQSGDKLVIESYRSYAEDDEFTFSFRKSYFDPTAVELEEIRVVPNPYLVGAEWEELQNVHQVRFMFLPPVCTINIYSISGERVRSLEHNSYSTGDTRWNLTNESNQAVAFGVYVYVVSTPQGQKHTGKLAIIR